MNRAIAEQILPETDNHVIEQAIKNLSASNTQENVWKLIHAFQSGIQDDENLLIPVLDEEADDLYTVGKLSLSDQDTMVLRKVELAKGGMALCGFTSQTELGKGQQTEFREVPLHKALSSALKDDSVLGLLINPWGLSILLDKQLLSLILEEEPSQKQSSSSIYIYKGSVVDQKAEAIVNAAEHPFGFDEECSREILAKAGPDLQDECPYNEEPAPLEVKVSSAGDLPAKMIIHGAIPEEPTEKDMILLIRRILDTAKKMNVQSLAMPAIGSEQGNLNSSVPLAVIVVAAWLNENPSVDMAVTITCENPMVYEQFKEYLFSEDES